MSNENKIKIYLFNNIKILVEIINCRLDIVEEGVSKWKDEFEDFMLKVV